MSNIHVTTPSGEQAEYDEEEFRSFREQGLFQSDAQYWKDGMPEWRPLQEYHDNEVPAPVYCAPPQTELIEMNPDSEWDQYYGGIGRLPYLGITILLGIVGSLLPEGGVSISLLSFAILLPAVYYRLKNIGMNPWFCALIFVPIANLFIGIRCLIFPEGYQDTRKLDTAGRVNIVLLSIAILIGVAVLILQF